MNKILFSERLAELRKERGFKNQYAFAKAYNERYSPDSESSGILGTIKNYENGNKQGSPKLDIVCNMCELLDCDIEYLLGEIPVPKHETADIQAVTGLSEKSISVMQMCRRYNQTDWVLDALNAVVSADAFMELLVYVVKYTTAKDSKAKLQGTGPLNEYLLKDVYRMKITDIFGKILTDITPEFENRADYRDFYKIMLSLYKNPDRNGKYHPIDEFREEIENAGLEFDPVLFEGGKNNG